MTSEKMPDTDQEFETLLDYLKRSRGVDLTGYKRPSLMRRVRHQMQGANIQTYPDYISHLEASPGEVGLLFDTLLINVTSFFRDMPAWEALQKEVVPQILASKNPDDPIRIWCAGCASGEEPYTVAMIFAEAMDKNRFRDHVRIHATDLDEDALAYARQASYDERQVQSVPQALREKYFERIGARYAVDKSLRHAAIFGRHDLMQDVPISRLDLLVCRNALMYFNAEVQARILTRFHFALNSEGFLMLGKAEMLIGRSNLFAPVDISRRIFEKATKATGRDRSFFLTDAVEDVPAGASSAAEAAFQSSPLAQVVVDSEGTLVLASERARIVFHLAARDIGRPFHDLALSYQPVELRSCIEKCSTDRRPVVVKGVVSSQRDGEIKVYDVHVAPLMGAASTLVGVCISFSDITSQKHLQDELEASNRDLRVAYEEAQSANEELETVNEELQSSAEELETTNEELQSANEELATMNEELQSSAEELETTNDELRQRSQELAQTTEFMEALMSSLPGGLVVIRPDLEIQAWNHKAEDLWGLRSEEAVGKSLMCLDIGFAVEKLYPMVSACLSNSSPLEEITVEATNRRGRPISCKISCMPIMNRNNNVRGAMLLMSPVA